MAKILKNNQTLYNLFQQTIEKVKDSLLVLKLGKINTFYSTTQTADIELLDKFFVDGKVVDYPLLQGVPIFVLQGGGSSIQTPINSDDFCLVFFADTDTSNWYEAGIAPTKESNRKHHLSDSFALVGVRPPSSPLNEYTEDGVVVKSNIVNLDASDEIQLNAVGDVKIASNETKIDSNGIFLGETATKPVVLNGDLIDFSQLIITAPTGGGPCIISGFATTVASATKTKAE